VEDRTNDWKPGTSDPIPVKPVPWIDFAHGRTEIGQETSPLVSCFWCGRLHPGEHPVSVCPACAATFSTIARP